MDGNRHDTTTGQKQPHLDLSNPEFRYEHGDVNVWAVGKFGIALVVLCLISLALLFGLFRYFLAQEGGKAAGSDTAITLPPAPTLQVTPTLDLQAMRAAEDKFLGSYGWVDQPKGIVHIPIDKAIDLLAQRGLPSRPQADEPAEGNVSMPTESGLGPKAQQAGGPLAGVSK